MPTQKARVLPEQDRRTICDMIMGVSGVQSVGTPVENSDGINIVVHLALKPWCRSTEETFRPKKYGLPESYDGKKIVYSPDFVAPPRE